MVGCVASLQLNRGVADIGNMAAMGGGIAINSGVIWSLCGDLHVDNNTATRGSAICIYSLVANGNSFHNISFRNNLATSGGTVFWVYDTN